MKTNSTTIPSNHPHTMEIRLFKDRFGNWFAGAEVCGRVYFTATYTTPTEAVVEAVRRSELQPSEAS